MGQTLAKIALARTRAVVMVPDWPLQNWYLQYISVFPKTKADKHTVCLKTQTTRGKGNSMANMVLEASFCGSADNKYVGNIKKWMVHAKDIGNIKLQNVLDLLSTIFEK